MNFVEAEREMAQPWSPMSQLQRSPEPDVWYLFDKST
jgi:hypothetical protein